MIRSSVSGALGRGPGVATLAVVVVVVLAGCSGSPGYAATDTTDGDQTVTDGEQTVTDGEQTPTDDGETVQSSEESDSPTTTDQRTRSTDDGGDSPVTTVDKPMPAALDSRLYELTTASDPAAYAEEHGLDYRNGSVKVVVELDSGASLPEQFDLSVTATADDRVQAYVPVGQLVRLAEHANTTVVRTPDVAEPAGANPADPTTDSNS